jgi:maltose alpha-D-glucosyltransferase/alpha-amylase
MTDWHTRAIIYQIDTALFYDLNGDGCGDIAGIAAKLRYIRRMGGDGYLDHPVLPHALSR